MNKMNIRMATPGDAEEILNIYAYYIENTAVTFEYDIPTIEEFRGRIVKTLKRYPYLVLEDNETIMGYAYAGPLKERAAYDWSVETSIYTHKDSHGVGYGRKLYEALECALVDQGILNLYACIAYPIVEDEYLTKNSAQFHEHLGYKTVGEFYKCGYKFGRWYNMIWMEKLIGKHK